MLVLEQREIRRREAVPLAKRFGHFVIGRRPRFPEPLAPCATRQHRS
jgi:hypothetical protein